MKWIQVTILFVALGLAIMSKQDDVAFYLYGVAAGGGVIFILNHLKES